MHKTAAPAEKSKTKTATKLSSLILLSDLMNGVEDQGLKFNDGVRFEGRTVREREREIKPSGLDEVAEDGQLFFDLERERERERERTFWFR